MAKMTPLQKLITSTTIWWQSRFGGGSAPAPIEFPPSERVFYLRAESGEILLTENGDALVTEQSAT